MLAILRPASLEWLLFLHVGAALLFFGALFTAAVAGFGAARREIAREVVVLTRVAHRALVLLAWPSFVAFYAAGEALASREAVSHAAWVNAGRALAVVAVLAGGGVLVWHHGRVLRRAAALAAAGGEGGDELRRLQAALLPRLLAPALVVLVGVAVWLMTERPV